MEAHRLFWLLLLPLYLASILTFYLAFFLTFYMALYFLVSVRVPACSTASAAPDTARIHWCPQSRLKLPEE